jgi:8-oxo-dGTP pyrophosphatase MutT (NUDIX family)
LARPGALVAAMKSIPGGARYTPAPQSSGMGRISPVQAEAWFQNSYANAYGPFLPRPSSVFTNGAFSPMAPIQPVPLDEPPPGGLYPDPRWWQVKPGWNLPTPPGTEGLKLASFDQLYTLARRYSVARAAIDLRQQEIRGLRWDISLTTDAAKAYQGDSKAMRDFGERKAKAVKFFRRPDPDFWNFDSFLNAFLEEIFVYDALCVIFRPKYGAALGMPGRGLLGSELDSLRLVSGPTIRPLIDLHGGRPAPPSPAFQQFLYGVPRSDFMTIATERDISDAGLEGSEVNQFGADVMLYAPYWPQRESPYGFPPVERALLPIISGLQKQEFQLDYFREGSVPSVYISPGDPNITPTQIGELQNALNALAGDPAYHLKVVVLPPGSKVDPQRPVDLSDSFDYLVMNQVCMAFDVQPQELGIIPDIGQTATGPSASGVRFAGQQSRDIKSRKSTLPLLQYICDIFNHVLQDICQQPDMQFTFEGLVDDEDKQAITELGVQQVQNGIASIDEVRERLDLPPWGLRETSEPVVFTAQGPVPFSMAPQLIMAAAQGGQGGQGTNSGQRTASSRSRTKQPAVRQGGQTKPNGSHPAPLAPHREGGGTPGHAAARGAIQSPTPRTGGTTSRSSVAGSRKKAIEAEFSSLARHLRKGAMITEWEPRHISNGSLAMIAEDVAKGVLLDVAVDRAQDIELARDERVISHTWTQDPVREALGDLSWTWKALERPFPGWQHDLRLVAEYTAKVAQAFQDAEIRGSEIRKDAATGKMCVPSASLPGIIADATRDIFLQAMTPMWEQAWALGYASGCELAASATVPDPHQLQGFLDTEGQHWLDQVSRTGLGSSDARSQMIARTEVARAMNTGALQAYRDAGVAYKHLLTAPGDACEICQDAADDGDIPLDAPFSAGGILGLCHVQCRCAPAPSGVEAEPPLAHLDKGFITVDQARQSARDHLHDHQDAPEDETRVCWLLIRARDEDGKWRYLLQQRDSGQWGMPGGSAHIGEDPFTAAYRETTEEIGTLPPLDMVGNFNHTDPDGKSAYLYLMQAQDTFTPAMNGSTPEETAGTGWFRRKEIGDLDLTGKFRDDWDHEVHLRDRLKDPALKVLRNRVDENGQQLVLDDDQDDLFPAQGGGARWPYPHNRQGAEWPDAGPGAVPGPSAGGEPPRHDPDGTADGPQARLYPSGDEDEFPRRRGRTSRPASRFPNRATENGRWPDEPDEDPGTGARSIGAKNDSGHPVVGVYEPRAGKPAMPHSVPPEAFDPAETVEDWQPEADSDVVHPLPQAKKGAADFSDPNPVEAEHIYLLMAKNFPPEAISWVKRARWIGPVQVPWDRIDTQDEDKWAASHQPGKVKEFRRALQAHSRHVAPSILVQEPSSGHAYLVDGHHRALAHRQLGQKVVAYIGNIDPRDRQAALETHTKQIHQGASPENT